MLGMGAAGSYVHKWRTAYTEAISGAWRTVNEVAYTNGQVTVVRTEHFKAQVSFLPDWLGET